MAVIYDILYKTKDKPIKIRNIVNSLPNVDNSFGIPYPTVESVIAVKKIDSKSEYFSKKK